MTRPIEHLLVVDTSDGHAGLCQGPQDVRWRSDRCHPVESNAAVPLSAFVYGGGKWGVVGGDQVKVRQIIRLLEQDGWCLAVTKGSHRQYKHPTKVGRVTVAGAESHEMARGTLNSVLRQAQLKKRG